MALLIEGGHIIDPGRFNAIGDLVIDEGKIVAIGQGVKAPPGATRIYRRAVSSFLDSSTSTCTFASLASSTKRRYRAVPHRRSPADLRTLLHAQYESGERQSSHYRIHVGTRARRTSGERLPIGAITKGSKEGVGRDRRSALGRLCGHLRRREASDE